MREIKSYRKEEAESTIGSYNFVTTDFNPLHLESDKWNEWENHKFVASSLPSQLTNIHRAYGTYTLHCIFFNGLKSVVIS